MHNATTKQRLSALRRRLGFLGGASAWASERTDRLEAAVTDLLRLARGGDGAASEPTPAFGFAMPAAAMSAPPRIERPARWVSAGVEVSSERFATAPTQVVPTEELVHTAEVPAPGGASTSDAAATEYAPEPEPLAATASDVRTEDFPEPERTGTGWKRPAVIAALVLAAIAGLVALLWPAAPDRAPASTEPDRVVAAPAPATPAPAAAAPAAPEPAAPPVPTHVVVARGDSLWILSRAHLGDPLRWPHLHAANRAAIRDPDLIYPGQTLLLPR